VLESTERQLGVQLVVAVNPDSTGLKSVSDSVSSVDVLREDGRGETVDRVVGGLDNLVLGFKGRKNDDGAEDLLSNDIHVRGDVSEDCWLNEVTVLAVPLTAGDDGGTLLLTALDVVHDSIGLRLRNLWSLEGVLLEWVTDLELQSCLLEQLGELVVDRLLDVDSGSGAACLTVVEEYTLSGVLDGLLEIGILEDDVRALATKLKGDLLQVGLGGLLHDESTDVGGTSEGDLVDVWVGGKGVSDSWTVTANDVYDTGWETSFVEELGHVHGAQWRELGWLDDDGTSSRESWSDLPRKHVEGEVPWDNLTGNTDWLMLGVAKLLVGGLDDLALNLVGPTTVVSEDGGRLGDIEALGSRERLTVVESLDTGKDVQISLDELGDLGENSSSLEPWGVVAPDSVECLSGNLDGDIDISGESLWNGGQVLSRGWVDDVNGFGTLVYGSRPFAIDEQSGGDLDFALETGVVEFVGECGHFYSAF